MYSDFFNLAAEVSGSFVAFIALIKGLGIVDSDEEIRLPLLLLFVACFLAFLCSLLPNFFQSWRVLNGFVSILQVLLGGVFVGSILKEYKSDRTLYMHKVVIYIFAISMLPATVIIVLCGANAIGYLSEHGELLFALHVFYLLMYAVLLFGSFLLVKPHGSRERV